MQQNPILSKTAACVSNIYLCTETTPPPPPLHPRVLSPTHSLLIVATMMQQGAVIFPQQIALAATFNPKLAGEAGRVAARDTRAAAVPWLFSPILGLATQPLWPRTYETFGEDPYLASRMGSELVKGIQASLPGGVDADDGEPLKAAACMKHFVGYSHPTSGHDRSPSRIPDQELLEMYLAPFQAAVDAQVASAMESYNELNGVPVASSRKYLVDVLRGRLQFLGMLVTDYAEIVNLDNHHGVSGSAAESVGMAMRDTSIDMSMVPTDASFTETLLALAKSGAVSENRINRSVRRILSLKVTFLCSLSLVHGFVTLSLDSFSRLVGAVRTTVHLIAFVSWRKYVLTMSDVMVVCRAELPPLLGR